MIKFTEYKDNFLVYNNNDYLTHDSNLIEKIKNHHCLYPHSITGRIWFSKSLNEVYSEFQTSLKTHNKNEAFLDNTDTWHNGAQGIPRIHAQFNGKDEGANYYWNNLQINYTSEYFISDIVDYKKYEGKSILILGGGPTTNLSNWTTVEYDYLWSMNYFFLNETIVKSKPDLVSLGNEVDFTNNNNKLYSYLENSACDIIIQPNDVRKNINYFISKFKDRICYFSPRWNGKLGASQRLLLLAIFSKAKHIYIAGIDGITPMFNKDLGNLGLHSFQTNLHFKEGYSYDIMVVQNVIFWQYVLDLTKTYDFTIHNLGEGHPANMATDITQKFFKQ